MRIATEKPYGLVKKSAGAVVKIYLAAIMLWAGAYWLFGDRIELLGLANSLAIFLFYPLPIVPVYLFFAKKFGSLPLWVFSAAVFWYYWGPLFVTLQAANTEPQEVLRIMTFNVEGRRGGAVQIIETILTEDTDVVLFQELTSQIAASISEELINEYPYQVLSAEASIGGKGAISKFPLQDANEHLSGPWKGSPQVLVLEWGSRETVIINFHMVAADFGEQEIFAGGLEAREATSQALVEFVQGEISGIPVIAAGDANATHLNSSYKTLTTIFADAWWEQGFGLGHTYPFDNSGNGLFSIKRGFPVPRGLVRIDYIFYTGGWRAIATHLAAHNGGSDHRAVVATLTLENE